MLPHEVVANTTYTAADTVATAFVSTGLHLLSSPDRTVLALAPTHVCTNASGHADMGF